MSRIVFINRYFAPDHSATSQILSDLAFDLAAGGHEVHVVTSRQLYDNAQLRLPHEEITRGVHLHRVFTTRFGRSALIGRGFDYLSFYIAAWRTLLRLIQPGDTLVSMTDPPLLSVLAMRVAERRGAHLVNWLQDIYPEIAAELGVPFMAEPIATAICRLRDTSLKRARANVVVGQRMAEKLLTIGVPRDLVQVIPNWCDDAEIAPIAPTKNPLRNAWHLSDKFIVGYSGNLGRAHEFATLLAAAERLKDDARIMFLLIGGGHQFEALARGVKARGLERNFQFMPYQPLPRLKYSLSVPDVHWISLRPELEGLIVPSKAYGIAAAGRAMIAITARDGEIARLVHQHHCGLVVEPGDDAALAAAIVCLSNDPARTAAMGRRARLMLEEKLTRRHALENWRKVLKNVS
jgi:colanic acid biosynthesis glycosyl transferase WcaI